MYSHASMMTMAALNWMAGMAYQYAKLATAISQEAKAGTRVCSPATVAVCSSAGYLPPMTTEESIGCEVATLEASAIGLTPTADKT